ncbi:MAG: LysR family transcriptional regulator [Desulfobacterales bacterium]|nr:LysR family transcriptional regulator [Desulfobacterales bacterium]
MYPDLNRLKVFYFVYESGSIIKAAEKLHISQPAVSQQIKKLETEIRAPLFTRLHKRIVPTSAAHRLFGTVSPFLEKLACEIDNISTPMDRPYGNLNIGAPIIFGTTYLPRICHEFRTRYPDVSFRVKFGESDVLMDMLNRGNLDLALIDFFSPYDQLPGKPDLYRIDALMQEHFVLTCSRDYYENRVGQDISFENLIRQDYLTDENDPMILRHWFWFYFNRAIPDLNIVMAIEAHQALMACIRKGMGMAISSHHLFAQDIEQGEIISIFPKREKLINTISMVSLRAGLPTVAQKAFEIFLKERVGSVT